MTEHAPEDDFGYPDPFALDDEPTEVAVPDEPDDEEDNHTDFDAFWRKRTKAKKPAPTATVLGVNLTLPRSLPVQYQLEVARQQRLKREQQNPIVLMTILLGEQQTKQLLRAGLDFDQYAILLAWIPAKIQGSNMTLEEVAAELEEFERKRREQGDEPGEA